MVDIKDYIRSLRKKGYNTEQIKDYLKKYNYDSSTIEKALSSTINIKKVFIVSATGVGIFMLVLLFMFLIKPSENEVIANQNTLDADYSERIIISGLRNIEKGQNQEFLIEFLNFDGKNTLKYDVVVSSDKGIVYQTSSEASILYTGKEDVKIDESYLDAGEYKLEISVNFKERILKDEKTFEVLSKERVGEVRSREETTIKSIEKEIETSLNDARKKCLLSFDTDDAKDKCLLRMSLLSNNEMFCSDLSDVEKRDNCYYNVAIKEEKYFLCEKINNAFMKNACMP